MILNTPTEIPCPAGVYHLVTANGGDVVIEKQLENFTYVAVQGSPLLDGEEREFATTSFNGKIRVTPSQAGVEFNLVKSVTAQDSGNI